MCERYNLSLSAAGWMKILEVNAPIRSCCHGLNERNKSGKLICKASNSCKVKACYMRELCITSTWM